MCAYHGAPDDLSGIVASTQFAVIDSESESHPPYIHGLEKKPSGGIKHSLRRGIGIVAGEQDDRIGKPLQANVNRTAELLEIFRYGRPSLLTQRVLKGATKEGEVLFDDYLKRCRENCFLEAEDVPSVQVVASPGPYDLKLDAIQ